MTNEQIEQARRAAAAQSKKIHERVVDNLVSGIERDIFRLREAPEEFTGMPSNE